MRRKKGTMLAESVTVVSIFFPIMIFVLGATLESSYAFVIGRNMSQGARLAARALAIYHLTNPEVMTTPSEQQAIFSQIRIANMVSGNAQFSIPSNGWNLAATPPTVTVVVNYLPGQGSPPLPAFPMFDPLKLGSLLNVSASATYPIQ